MNANVGDLARFSVRVKQDGRETGNMVIATVIRPGRPATDLVPGYGIEFDAELGCYVVELAIDLPGTWQLIIQSAGAKREIVFEARPAVLEVDPELGADGGYTTPEQPATLRDYLDTWTDSREAREDAVRDRRAREAVQRRHAEAWRAPLPNSKLK